MDADPPPALIGAAALDDQLAGLDALELGDRSGRSAALRLWAAAWPKVVAVATLFAVWQLAVVSHWRPSYVLPGPVPVVRSVWHAASTAVFWKAVAITMRRAVGGYVVAAVVGVVLGGLVATSRPLRSALGSLITGLQTMPSIAWFPLAILLFKLSEAAIMFVVVVGAAPSIANGFIAGVDHVPPSLLRSGRMLGARGITLWRHVIVPAALPSVVGGLKQGWAFAWRSLMAGELLVIVAHRPSIGERLQFAEQQSDAVGLLGLMAVILILGIAVDGVFGTADRSLRRRWGLGAGA